MDLDVTSISVIVAAAGVLIGVAYYILDMRSQAKTRQTDMVMSLYSTFSSKEFQVNYVQVHNLQWKNTEDFLEKFAAKTNAEVWASWQSIAAFFEQVGILLHRRLIDISLIDDLLSTPVQESWEKMSPIIIDRRKALKRPQIWEWFEYLYNETKKREQKLQQKTGVKSG